MKYLSELLLLHNVNTSLWCERQALMYSHHAPQNPPGNSMAFIHLMLQSSQKSHCYHYVTEEAIKLYINFFTGIFKVEPSYFFNVTGTSRRNSLSAFIKSNKFYNSYTPSQNPIIHYQLCLFILNKNLILAKKQI